MNISEEAVEAAAIAISECGAEGWKDQGSHFQVVMRRDARLALEAAAPHMLAEATLDAVRELHTEDLFRGHLSNGCRTCGNVGDLGYPCPTIIALGPTL